MVQSTVSQGHIKQTTAGLLHRLLNGGGYLAGFALAHSNAAIAIAYHCQCSKAHGAATFYYFTDAVYRDHFFTKAVFAILIGMPALCFSHLSFLDRKSTRLNSSHVSISYAGFCF